MKRAIYFLLILTLIVVLSACGDNDNAKSGSDSSDGDSVTFKVAGQDNEDHPNIVALEKMAENVEEETDGRVKLEIYPANQLGDYTLMYEEIGKGSVDMGLISVPTHLDERMELNSLPYLFENYDQASQNFQLDTFLGETLQEIHEEQGIKLLGFFAEGMGGFGTTEEINEPTNLDSDKGVLMRVPPIEVSTESIKNLGFKTSSLPFDDVYQALQTGTIEGFSGAHAPANYLQFRDVIKYYYQYNDFFEAKHLMINQDKFDDLSDEDQETLLEHSQILTDESFETAEENEEEYKEKMEEEGIEVIEFSDEELKKFADDERENVWPLAEDSVGKDLLDDIIENIEEE